MDTPPVPLPTGANEWSATVTWTPSSAGTESRTRSDGDMLVLRGDRDEGLLGLGPVRASDDVDRRVQGHVVRSMRHREGLDLRVGTVEHGHGDGRIVRREADVQRARL